MSNATNPIARHIYRTIFIGQLLCGVVNALSREQEYERDWKLMALFGDVGEFGDKRLQQLLRHAPYRDIADLRRRSRFGDEMVDRLVRHVERNEESMRTKVPEWTHDHDEYVSTLFTCLEELTRRGKDDSVGELKTVLEYYHEVSELAS